jgi:hypothetical protein
MAAAATSDRAFTTGRRRRCRSCGAPLRWVTSDASGAAMPLDAAPTSAGNVVLETDLLGGESAVVLGPDAADTARDAGEELWMPHWKTCPDAERWRR